MSSIAVSSSVLASYQSCSLCPRNCHVDRLAGERGVCGAGASLRAGRAALHWWEEPCLVGNKGSGAIFFAHCPLKCVYCQNYALARGEGIDFSLERLAEIMLELQDVQHAANINLVTPSQYAAHLAAVLAPLRTQGRLTIPVINNSSGYESSTALSLFNGNVDIYLVDFKYASSVLAQSLSNAKDYPAVALSALKTMFNQVGIPEFDSEGYLRKGIIVRHLLLPGRLEQSCEALKLVWDHFGTNVLYSIMGQYTPLSNLSELEAFGLTRAVDQNEYESLLDYADRLGMEEYFWQESGAAKESFIPAFDGTGITKQ